MFIFTYAQNQWIPDLNLTNEDQLNIRNQEEIDDFIILQAMNLLQKQHPISLKCIKSSALCHKERKECISGKLRY